MAATQHQPPAGRYGRGDDAASDRRLKRIGALLGAVALAGLGWFGVSYVTGTDVSGEMIKFDVTGDREVAVHLEVRKETGVPGVCTLRALAESGAEVGRKDVRVDAGEPRVDTVVTVRTTQRATGAELIGCQPAAG